MAYGYLPVNRLEPNENEKRTLETIYRKLAEARKKRTLNLDVKLVTSQNGLALQAYSQAAEADPRYAAIAKDLRNFAVNTLWQNGELAKGMSKGRLIAHGELEDYAYLSAGLLTYSKTSGDEESWRIARELMVTAWRNFHTTDGWKAQNKSLLAGSPFHALVEDWATPSPSATLISASLQSGDTELMSQGHKSLEMGHEILNDTVFWHATQVRLLQPAK
jgi:uncharacterized protein YyaL (SSP411 family)